MGLDAHHAAVYGGLPYLRRGQNPELLISIPDPVVIQRRYIPHGRCQHVQLCESNYASADVEKANVRQTDGSPKWRERTQKLLDATGLFFPKGDIMVEVACEPMVTCNNDQPSFKAFLARWMAATAQIAPWTEKQIMPRLRASAIGAAKQCVGGPQGRTCGRKWTESVWDGRTGVGEEMSALSVIQANLIQKVAPPLTANTGGVSKSDPTAGAEGDNPAVILEPLLTRKITMGDRAGAGILTALTLGGLLATIYWISF